MTFKQLHLIEPLMRALEKEEYTTPTPIQLEAIPPVLKGKDLIGIAQTGTGKTAAFVLPLLQRMQADREVTPPGSPRALILTPTRELAAQIGKSVSTYGRYMRFRHTTIFGGVGQNPQVNDLRRGVDILIATPGRLLDLMGQGHVKLSHVKFFILDEADRMLDMGFIHDVRKIVLRLPTQRQSLFFSATMPSDVAELASRLLTDPFRVEVTPQAMIVQKIVQRIFFVDQHHKNTLLFDLLKQKHLTCVLVFTRTKHRANKVAQVLMRSGISADAIHGNKSQSHRTKALSGFKKGRVKVLVATDIAARGIDIEGISHVINYDMPNESESYVHRIGRTARAGAEGTAYSFCAADERSYLHGIERLIGMKIEVMEHAMHSDAAQTAVGSAAKPPQRGARPPSGFRAGREASGMKRKGGVRKPMGKHNQKPGGYANSGPKRETRQRDGESRSSEDRPRYGSSGSDRGPGRKPFRGAGKPAGARPRRYGEGSSSRGPPRSDRGPARGPSRDGDRSDSRPSSSKPTRRGGPPPGRPRNNPGPSAGGRSGPRRPGGRR
ncbi:MAG: DEAD/DEAH box helicase [archaeon]